MVQNNAKVNTKLCVTKSVFYTMEKPQENDPATFEKAVVATGFGKFNVLLILLTLPPSFSKLFETASMSYVLPIAQCDLNLSLSDKGMLNAITFAGMITSGFVWGYLCDVSGRKKVMVFGYLLDGLFVLMASLSQNFNMLLISKFFGGLIINGPHSASTSYLSEFHASQYRARVQIARGIIASFGNIALPVLAWLILPQDLNFTIYEYIDVHSWNIFLFICSLASITSGVIYIFMPESPKFLMSTGKNEEALRLFQRIYSINTGKSADTYPAKDWSYTRLFNYFLISFVYGSILFAFIRNIAKMFLHIKELVDETLENGTKAINGYTDSAKKSIVEGLYQIKPLFCRPHLSKLVHVCANAVLILMSLNTLKLWFPQLFQAINDYEFTHNGSSSNMCDMLDTLKTKNTTSSICAVNLDNSSVYINAIIIGMTSMLVFGIAGTLVNLLGKKGLTVYMALIAGFCATSLYFAQNSYTVLVLSAIFLSFGAVCGNVLVTITLELFPTPLRAMALSFYFMFARSGSLIGNMVFPTLLTAGCLPPFLFVGAVMFGCAGLTFLYPNTENKALT